ncbi:DNA-3-methyladenine glycosylase 1 [Spirochaetota bacterium]|nr:DNA-3-methyladenine glycosylase 1 [Spirochaetota bacterium]
MISPKNRCQWVNLNNPRYIDYHDTEWGVAIHDDQKHFELLCLEGAQAGLNWETILNKRSNYRTAFYNFNPTQCARLSDSYLANQLKNTGIVRNRLKIAAIRKNATVFLTLQQEYRSFDNYIWRFVNNKQIVNKLKGTDACIVTSPESDAIAKDLKKRGMSFIGSTIIYAYMQAAGLVNDHLITCFRYKPCLKY